jgi:hypothetical protein
VLCSIGGGAATDHEETAAAVNAKVRHRKSDGPARRGAEADAPLALGKRRTHTDEPAVREEGAHIQGMCEESGNGAGNGR